MGHCFHHRRRARALPLLAAVTVLTVLFSAAAAQVALANHGKTPPKGGQPPCPSCPDRTPPVGGNGGSGSGGGGGTANGGNSGAASVPAVPLVSLGSISVVNGVASLTGTVNIKAAVSAAVAVGSTTAQVHVAVNGNPVSVSAKGTFTASTNLEANGNVNVQAGELGAGITYSISIPASAIVSGNVQAEALAQLQADGVTLMLPPDGFTIVDGLGIDASVQAVGVNGIAKLDLNGTDLLAKLKLRLGSGSSGGSSSSSSGSSGSGSGSRPGGVKPGGGSAPAPKSTSAPVSGTAKTVKLKVTGTNGTTQTTTVQIQRISSVVRIGRSISISAFGARSIRIAKVTFNRTSLRSSGKLGVAVTVQDRRHYLVRDAVVMLQPFAHHTTVRGSLAGMTNMLGRATFSVPVASKSLGAHFYVRVVARTPRSQTHVTASTFLVACGC